MKKTLRTLMVAVTMMMLSLVALPRANAQLDYNEASFGIYQRGVLVGEVYRAETDPSNYVEHWVLYPTYVYPNVTNGIVTTLQPGHTEYRDAKDFLGRVPFERGSRYVTATCNDGTKIPGR